jgi:hypothetical protein
MHVAAYIIFFTVAAGPLVAIAMWLLQFCVLFFIFVRLCRALRHSGARHLRFIRP